VNKKSTNENENSTENNGSEYPPEESFVIVLFFNLEIFKNKKYNKDVINRESVLRKVCREIFYSTLCPAVIIFIYEKAEQGRDHYPENGLVES
jgi:hypothetical protein